jgi:hypothetical protein
MPAGTQFPGASERLPLRVDTVTVAFGGESLFFGTGPDWPNVATLEDGSWSIQPIDDGRGYDDPRGQNTRAGFAVSAAASDGSRVVVVGSGGSATGRNPPALPFAHVPLIWTSSDGLHYQRFDPRTLFAEPDGLSIRMRAVHAAGGGGFLAIADVARANGKKPADVVVFRSADGVSWSLLTTLQSTWSLRAEGIWSLGGERLLVHASEFACDATGESQTYNPGGAAMRLWQSADGGLTWQLVDLAQAAPVLDAPEPPPATAAGCPPGRDREALDRRFKTTGDLVGVVDDRLVAAADDGSQTATTADLATWSLAGLPGGLRTGAVDGQSPQAPAATLLTGGPDGWVLRSLEARKDADGGQLKTGCHVYWWTSRDLGVSWAPGTLGRPLRACTGFFATLRELADRSVVLFTIVPPVYEDPPRRYIVSTESPLVEWGTCVPAAGADCAFVTLAGAGGEPANWRNIDLSGSMLTEVRLSDAVLTGATLTGATLDGDMSGAEFRGAFLFNTVLSGDLSRADFRGSQLSSVSVEGSLRGADMSGLYVFQARFHGDLTGMKVKGTSFTSTTFLPGTTCPDGKPASNADGPAACRL